MQQGRENSGLSECKKYCFVLIQILHSSVQRKRRVSALGIQGKHPEENTNRHPDGRQHVWVRCQNLWGRKRREVEHLCISEDPWVRYALAVGNCLSSFITGNKDLFFRGSLSWLYFRGHNIEEKSFLVFPHTAPHHIHFLWVLFFLWFKLWL